MSQQLKCKDWYLSERDVDMYNEFEKRYLDIPRKIFLEIALSLLPYPTHKILDIGCGTGSGVKYIKSRLGKVKITAIDPSAAMLKMANDNVSDVKFINVSIEDCQDDEKYDLILSYSNLRLWKDPVKAFKNISQMLTPHGLAYILDLRGDSEEIKEIVLQNSEVEFRDFLKDQLSMAYKRNDLEHFLSLAEIKNFEIKVGGLGGCPSNSPEAFALIQQNEHLAKIIFDKEKGRFSSSKLAESVFHIFIRKEDCHEAGRS